ncbi:MAG: PKD domain-containing protein [Candidatus Kerfeldbacteria bacterium]|nr:PKD domain-containing protein [Candidatus Kerfeldbacteria bacterium]
MRPWINTVGFSLGLVVTILSTPVSLAQEEGEDVVTPTDVTLTEQVPLVAEAGADKNVAVGRNVLFDASASSGPSDTTLTYSWDFGDGQTFQGIDASHIYAQPGTYKAKLTVSNGEETSHDSTLVSVAEDVALLIADDSVSRDQLRYYRQYAQRNGTLLVVIRPSDSVTLDYVLTRNVAEQIVSSEADITQAAVVLIWTEQNIGLNALTEVGQILSSGGAATSAGSISFAQKAIIQISDHPSSGALGRIAQTTYNTLLPQYVMLTTAPALEPILANPAVDKLTEQLQSEAVPYQLIGRHSQRALENITPLNFLSYGVNYLINKGVSQDTIFLLLVLPIVATLISFGRQIVGVKAFGIYVPSIMTLSFIVTGLRYGVLIFLVILAAATLARIAARRLHILYLPRMAIVLTAVSFTIFGLLLVSSYLGEDSILSLSIFPVLVMMILTEKFVEVQIEQGNRQAILLTAETLALATISYLIVTWEELTTLVLGYPEIVLLTIIINILLGRFSGLRIVEYFRFRKLLKANPKP